MTVDSLALEGLGLRGLFLRLHLRVNEAIGADGAYFRIAKVPRVLASFDQLIRRWLD